MVKWMAMLVTAGALLCLPACNTRHEVAVAPLKVEPIHITIDINIKVDRALDDFFGDLDKAADKITDKQPGAAQ